MGEQAGLTWLDRPWHRQGATRYALARLPGLLRPLVEVYESVPGSPEVLRDLSVTVRDGTILRVNVMLPAGGGRFPVLISAHPYGKDNLPTRRGRLAGVGAVPDPAADQPGTVLIADWVGGARPGLVGGPGLCGG